jgi:hypothetical protein
MIPKCLISDFDTKLVGGQAREYLNSLLVQVNAAPFHRIKMVWLNDIGKQWYLWLAIGLLLLNYLQFFGSMLYVMLLRYVTSFLISQRMALILLPLSWFT